MTSLGVGVQVLEPHLSATCQHAELKQTLTLKELEAERMDEEEVVSIATVGSPAALRPRWRNSEPRSRLCRTPRGGLQKKKAAPQLSISCGNREPGHLLTIRCPL